MYYMCERVAMYHAETSETTLTLRERHRIQPAVNMLINSTGQILIYSERKEISFSFLFEKY